MIRFINSDRCPSIVAALVVLALCLACVVVAAGAEWLVISALV